MNAMQVKVHIRGIEWDADYELEDEYEAAMSLPRDIDEYIVEESDIYDHTEMWNGGDRITGWEMLMNDLVEQLTDEFGWCISGIDDVELI